jgi:large subunit ribosomal protein L1
VVGKMSFDVVKLQENIESLLSYIRSLKPSASKGVYLRGVVVSATMLPSIVVAV